MAAPRYSKRWDIQAAPGWDDFPVTPDDLVDFADQSPAQANARTLFIESGGTIAFIPAGCPTDAVTFSEGTYTVSGASTHAIHAVINGVDSTATTTGTDAECAAALLAALIANSDLDDVATFALDPNDDTVIVVTAVPPGLVGNFTTTATGTGLTADQAALAGGTGVSQWTVPDFFYLTEFVRRVLATGTTAEGIHGMT